MSNQKEEPINNSLYTQLLAVATSAKKDEKMDPNVPPMSESDRQWLEDALKEIGRDSDPIRNLKVSMSRLQKSGDDGSELSLLQQNADDLNDLVCDLDLALDFCKLGGLKLIEDLLSKFSDEINQRVIPIIAEIAQNNQPVQEYVLKTKILDHLLSLLDESTTSPTTRLKIVGAVSAIVKHFPPGVIRFIQLGGLDTIFQTLYSAIDSEDERLVLRCVVMIVNAERGAAPELLKALNVDPAAQFEKIRDALSAEKYAEALDYLQSDPFDNLCGKQ